MSVIMGVGWSFGFVASLIDTIALWWIFIIITSLHGVFLFVVFVRSYQFQDLVRKRRTESIRKHQLQSLRRSLKSPPRVSDPGQNENNGTSDERNDEISSTNTTNIWTVNCSWPDFGPDLLKCPFTLGRIGFIRTSPYTVYKEFYPVWRTHQSGRKFTPHRNVFATNIV